MGDFPRSFPALRWLAVSDLHLTLQFYGNIGQADRHRHIAALNKLADVGPIHLDFSRWILLPFRKQPRVLAIGGALSEPLAFALSLINPCQNPQTFLPHITLARFRPALAPESLPELPRFSIIFDTAALFRSPDPGAGPQNRAPASGHQPGKYDRLFSVRL